MTISEKRKRSLANLRPIPKGVSLNPSGRKPVPQEVKDILAAATPAAARALVELIAPKNDPKVRLRASEIILDRVYGKATQSVDVQVTDVAKIHLQALQEIQARRTKRLEIEGKPAELIDVTPHTEKGAEIEQVEANNTNDFDDLC